MSQKINIIIIVAFLLMIGFGFAWANIDVEDVLDFDLAQDDMVIFNPPGALKPYSLGINSAGHFIIKQNGEEKFRIDPDGNVYIAGSVVAGTVPWDGVSVPTDCLEGELLTGINADGNLICQ